MKKALSLVSSALLLLSLAACGDASTSVTEAPEANNTNNTASEATPEATAGSFDWSTEITVVSREDGSGTRGAFVELFGVEEADADGNKVDRTTVEANVTQSTSVMMTTVAGDDYAIGYISLGSLNDSVKALQIEGVDATVENIKSGSYEVSRPFNIATTAGLSAEAQDFVDYILSAEGQAVVESNGYIASVDDAESYSGSAEGKIVVSGSSSVTPVMEKLKEAYEALNPGVEVELQTSDSSTGMKDAIDGNCDIGMASRQLKDSELEGGLTPTVIAIDGIAVIVNNNNPVVGLSKDDVKQIFVGEAFDWADFEA